MRLLFAPLFALLLGLTGLVAAPADASTERGCEGTVIVVEFGKIGAGDDQIRCADDAVGKGGVEALDLAGLDFEETTGAMPMVCRIEGLPTPADEKCGSTLSGKGYWAFLVATEGEPWAYATTGLRDHVVADGEYLALVYHLLADGETVTPATPADAATREAAVTATDADTADPTESEDSGVPIGLVVAVFAVAVVGAAAVIVGRRRSSGS